MKNVEAVSCNPNTNAHIIGWRPLFLAMQPDEIL